MEDAVWIHNFITFMCTKRHCIVERLNSAVTFSVACVSSARLLSTKPWPPGTYSFIFTITNFLVAGLARSALLRADVPLRNYSLTLLHITGH